MGSADGDQTEGAPAPAARETYTHGHSALALDTLAARTAEADAAFLLPHLRPGMRVLDFGCGPGGITLGLAAAVAPGEAVGVDIEPAAIERARAVAGEQGVANARFEVASVYALPFPDASFDAAFGRAVVQHLGEPVAALREVHRVLTPGGVVGVRDGDWGSQVRVPHDPLVAEARALYLRLWRHNGGDPEAARHHRALLRAAGFGRTAADAGATVQGTAEGTRRQSERWARHFTSPEVADQLVALGWVDRDRIRVLAEAQLAWGAHPDAFAAALMCETLGWKE